MICIKEHVQEDHGTPHLYWMSMGMACLQRGETSHLPGHEAFGLKRRESSPGRWICQVDSSIMISILWLWLLDYDPYIFNL